MGKIYLMDVTNRDGVQTAKLGLAKLEKTLINIYLNDMGVFQSEFGFPTTKHETNYLKANIKLADMGVLSPMRLEGMDSRYSGGCRYYIQAGAGDETSQPVGFHL